MLSTTFPQAITHEKALVDCDSEFEEFVKTMDTLGPKLGPMVFQFPLFDCWTFPKQDSFRAVLAAFLKKLPTDHNFGPNQQGEKAAADFLKPWYGAMLKMVTHTPVLSRV